MDMGAVRVAPPEAPDVGAWRLRARAVARALAPSPDPVRTDLPWKQIALQAGGLWLASRVAFTLITYFAVLLHAGLAGTSPIAPFSLHSLLESWDHWDVTYYLEISRHGYTQPDQTAFFPLFPLLVAAVTVLVGEAHRLAAAMLVSNLGALLAFIGIGFLAANEDAPEAAVPSILTLAAYPLAFFMAERQSSGNMGVSTTGGQAHGGASNDGNACRACAAQLLSRWPLGRFQAH
jgi:hypothetical protein